MAVIDWRDVYATGIVALDNEHRGLITEINRLYEAIRDKHGEKIVAEILDSLTTYTVDHFAHEEKLMSEYNFSGLEEHREIHQTLIEKVKWFRQRVDAGEEGVAQDLLKFLRSWLLEHILEVDKQYGPFLESRGGRFIE